MNHIWSNKYVGTPFDDFGRDLSACDCWGLAVVVYREELNITLPDYLGYGSTEERGEIAALISKHNTTAMWVPVTGTALAFDLAVFRRGRLATHVGIVVRHGLMLHMAGEDCAKHVDYQTGAWGNRLEGVYRHVEMISRGAI